MSKALVVKSIYILFIFYCLPTCVLAQSIEVSTGRNRSDFLIETGYGQYIQQHKFSGLVGVGITKTFNQRRFNPRIGVVYGFDFFATEKIFLGPTLELYSSTYLVTKSPKSRIWNEELLAGVRFEYGGKLKFGSFLTYGFMTEHFSENFYLSYGFNGKIGLIYCW